MKIGFRTFGLGLALLATLSTGGWAQSPPSAPPSAAPSAAPTRAARPHGDHEAAMMKRLKNDLGLSDEQVTKLQPILKSYHEQARERMKAARQELDSVLTPEQQAQLKQMHEQRMKERREKGTATRPPSGGATADGKKPTADGKRPAGPFAQLQLTDEQKAKLKALREKGMEQRKADQQALFAQTRTVLTPEQETKFEQKLSQRPHKPAGPPRGDGKGTPPAAH